MLKKLSLVLVFSIMFLMFLQFASAISPTYKQYEVTNFAIPCIINGAPCSNAATCQLTIQYPNASYLVDNGDMTYHTGGLFNYTIQFNTVGDHPTKVSCSQSGLNATSTFDIAITTTGEKSNLPIFLILALGSIIILGFAFAVQNEYIGFIGGSLLIMTGLFAIIYGIGDLANFYTDSIGWVSLGLGLMFMVAAGYSAAAGSGLFDKGEGFADSLDADNWGTP